MAFVKRDENGTIQAISDEALAGYAEESDTSASEFDVFLGRTCQEKGELRESDVGFIRVLEDVIELMIDKGLILFTDLHPSAQAKILDRQQMRSKISGRLDLLGDD